MRARWLALLLAGCSPHYIQQPQAGTARATAVAVDVETETATRVLEYRARELCAFEMQFTSDVMVAAGNSLRDARELTEPLCERPEVVAPFVEMLRAGVDEQLRTARDRASEAAERPCAPNVGQEGSKP